MDEYESIERDRSVRAAREALKEVETTFGFLNKLRELLGDYGLEAYDMIWDKEDQAQVVERLLECIKLAQRGEGE